MPLQVSGRKTGWPHWTTPQSFLDLLEPFGQIGFDPCSNQASKVGALHTRSGGPGGLSGLECAWATSRDLLVFVNPPYGREIVAWVDKMIAEAAKGVEIIALLPARTDSAWCHRVFATADAYCLWKGRIQFENGPPDGPNNGSSIANMVAYWGPRQSLFVGAFGKCGEVVLR